MLLHAGPGGCGFKPRPTQHKSALCLPLQKQSEKQPAMLKRKPLTGSQLSIVAQSPRINLSEKETIDAKVLLA